MTALATDLAAPWSALAGEAAQAKADLESRLRALQAEASAGSVTLLGELGRLPSARSGTPAVLALHAEIQAFPASASASATAATAALSQRLDAIVAEARKQGAAAPATAKAAQDKLTTAASGLLQQVKTLRSGVDAVGPALQALGSQERQACLALVSALRSQSTT